MTAGSDLLHIMQRAAHVAGSIKRWAEAPGEQVRVGDWPRQTIIERLHQAAPGASQSVLDRRASRVAVVRPVRGGRATLFILNSGWGSGGALIADEGRDLSVSGYTVQAPWRDEAGCRAYWMRELAVPTLADGGQLPDAWRRLGATIVWGEQPRAAMNRGWFGLNAVRGQRYTAGGHRWGRPTARVVYIAPLRHFSTDAECAQAAARAIASNARRSGVAQTVAEFRRLTEGEQSSSVSAFFQRWRGTTPSQATVRSTVQFMVE